MLAKLKSLLSGLQKLLIAFLTKYSAYAHTALLVWNIFVTSWATGLSVPLTAIGLPYTINARVIVSYLQLHTHFPTWLVAIGTFALNASVAYLNWKKNHPDTTAQNMLNAKKGK